MMQQIVCPTQEQWRELSTGRLPQSESDTFFEHLESCSKCRTEFETIQGLSDEFVAKIAVADTGRAYESEPNCQHAVELARQAISNFDDLNEDLEPQPIPSRIGDYEIKRLIGHGGMGRLFLARHTKLGREVALKILAPHRLNSPRMRQRFEAEIRTIGQMSHPNVVSALDARDVDGTVVLVTEYVDGFDIERVLENAGRLSISNACEIARRVAEALHYIHSHGYVHRDVKPANIMLSSQGDVKLLDLGLARFESSELEDLKLTGTGQTMGTADFISPEQATDSRDVDFRADLYSLGCTLFKLLTGRAPFATSQYPNVFAKLTAHVSERPPQVRTLRADVPVAMEKLLDSLLAKRRDNRPLSAGDVAQRLAEFTQSANLIHLVSTVRRCVEEPKQQTLLGPSKSTSHRQSSSRATVPARVAIALGLGGIVVGLVLGLIIRIRFPDGTVAEVRAPQGTTIEVKDDGKVSNRNASLSKPEATRGDELVGVWSAESAHVRGESHAFDNNNTYLLFDSNRFQVLSYGKVWKVGTYKLSRGRNHQVTLMPYGREYQEIYGVYEKLSDDRLKISFGMVKEDGFPESFDTAKRLNSMVVELSTPSASEEVQFAKFSLQELAFAEYESLLTAFTSFTPKRVVDEQKSRELSPFPSHDSSEWLTPVQALDQHLELNGKRVYVRMAIGDVAIRYQERETGVLCPQITIKALNQPQFRVEIIDPSGGDVFHILSRPERGQLIELEGILDGSQLAQRSNEEEAFVVCNLRAIRIRLAEEPRE